MKQLNICIVLPVLALAASVLFGGCVNSDIAYLDAQGKNIVCFGDSLTFGYGAEMQEAYPAQLAKMTSIPVVNAGINGDTTPEAIAGILVEDGFLTRYQAERILEGNPRGLMIDRYKLLEVLGAGGMGWVYIAEEVETRWRVALKVLPEACRNDSGTLRNQIAITTLRYFR